MSVTRPFDSSPVLYYKRSIITMRLLCTVTEIWRLRDNGSRVWPFGVTWRHRSRDHSTLEGRLPMGGPWWPCVYLVPLRRYGASNVGRTDVETKRRKEEEKEKKERVEEGKRKGSGRGKKGKRKVRVKGRGKGRQWEGERGSKEKRKGKGKGKGKERGKWKEESLRKVGRTDGSTNARTLRRFYTLSNAMHCIGQTTRRRSWECIFPPSKVI